MTFPLRVTLVLLAAFFLSTVATSGVAWLCARPLIAAATVGTAMVRARALACFRLLPSFAAAVITVAILVPGYLAYERGGAEHVSITLWLLAAAGAAVIAGGLVEIARSLHKTAALRREWLAAARPAIVPGAGVRAYEIDFPYPLVAVLGIVKPRLFISTQVLVSCPAGELSAIVEHERAHVRRRDNLLRLAMDAAPDLLRFTKVPAAIAGAWHVAVEHRADEAASERLDLASALVRVSRMASGAPAFALPASALYGGGATEDRVRRLLSRGGDTVTPMWAFAFGACAALSLALMAFAAGTGAVSRLSHAVLELTVSTLP